MLPHNRIVAKANRENALQRKLPGFLRISEFRFALRGVMHPEMGYISLIFGENQNPSKILYEETRLYGGEGGITRPSRATGAARAPVVEPGQFDTEGSNPADME